MHVKTGLSVVIQDSRSQHQNKKKALERLGELYRDHQRDQLKQQQADIWKDGIVIQRGNPIRTYEGVKFKRKK